MKSLPTPPGAAADLAAMLGDTLASLARGGDPHLLRRTVALLCREREQGHVCVPLASWQGQPFDDGAPPFPPSPAWRAELLATGLCGDGAEGAEPLPLVLDAADRLYLLRHFRAEQRLLRFLRQRLAMAAATTPDALRRSLGALRMLPPEGHTAPDWQLAAIAAAARCPFLLLTGGPGTGKTTTVARLLAVLLHDAPDLRIALAAPTGKAAARLGEALAERAAEYPHLAAVAARLQPRTLHRLLGYLPIEDAFRSGADQPLPYDVVVVDEASMVDPAILAVLVDALRPDARLVLVGDRDQLAAVAAGQVLGDLCRAARPERGVGEALATYVAQATGLRLPVQPGAASVADCVVALQENHRFGARPGIGGFAMALARRDHAGALATLQAGHADLRLAADAEGALAAIADDLLAAAQAPTAEAALQRLASVRVLAATRHGPMGALAWSRRVETMLGQRGVRTDDPWYSGRPVLVTSNDHQNQLWNGDLGVVWRQDDGRPHVLFPASGGGVRSVSPQRLPAHETAWAMTVHKAQGSEFDRVLLVMPERPGPMWQAPLVYTGVTRARQAAVVLADPQQLAACLAHWPARSSGLASGLGAGA